jgi:predicted metal-dependent HD superfamily phosphohydrolase
VIFLLRNEYLFREFEQACQNVNIKKAEKYFDLLTKLYSKKPREYHSLSHLKFIGSIQELQLYSEVNSATFIMKKWFHDAIYNPESKDNELNSKLLWEKIALKEGVVPSIIDNVSKGIDATNYGKYFPHNFEDKVFCDTDLSILGQPQDTYSIAASGIRKEYRHLNDSQFIEGRLKVIDYFLSLPRIYITERYVERFENQARLNLDLERILLVNGKILN